MRISGLLELKLQAVAACLEVKENLEARLNHGHTEDWKAALVRKDVQVAIMRALRMAGTQV